MYFRIVASRTLKSERMWNITIDWLVWFKECRLNVKMNVVNFNAFLILFSPLASKAVDCLLDSKWAKAKKGEEALFTTRESVVDYCNRYGLVSLIKFINEYSCQAIKLS